MEREEQIDFQIECIHEVFEEHGVTPQYICNLLPAALHDFFQHLPYQVAFDAINKISEENRELFEICSKIWGKVHEFENYRN